MAESKSNGTTATEPKKDPQALRALASRVQPSVVSFISYDGAYATVAEGAGFFIAPGRVATSRHLLRGARHARVMLHDGKVHEVLGVLGEDPGADVVVAAVDAPDTLAPPLALARALPSKGEQVAMFGGRLSVDREGVEGAVTAVREVPFLGRVFTVTSAPVPGASGSPVVGMDGQVLGLAVARSVEGGTLQFVAPAARVDMVPGGTFLKVSERPESVPGDPERLLAGVRCLLLEDAESAAKHFRAVADADPKDAAAWKACADALAVAGRGREAIECAQAAAGLEPENPDSWDTLGSALMAEGHAADAADAFRRVVRARPGDPRAWNRLGVACYDAGRHEEAVEACREAVRIRPEDSQTHKNLGVALFALGRFAESSDAFREAVRLKPEFDHAWKNLGLCYFRMGRLADAVEANLEAIRIRPDYARAHNNLGVIYQALGRHDDAVGEYREAVRLRPRFAQAWSNLAYAFVRLGKGQDALKAYEEALDRNPEDAEARTNLGVLYRKMGRPDDAKKAFVEAIRAEPHHAPAHYHLACLHLEKGDRGAALDEYRVLQDLDEERANRLFKLVYR
jgi:tetratricopeptide (TPR) repeat protein